MVTLGVCDAASQLHTADDLGPCHSPWIHHWLHEEREPSHALQHQVLGNGRHGEEPFHSVLTVIWLQCL